MQVNEQGGVTVLGTGACAAGVTAYYGANVPANLTIMINVGWTVTQRSASTTEPVGRAAPCVNNNPNLQVPVPALLNCGTAANPCPWRTWMFDGTGAQQPFFGTGFKRGPVRVALQSGTTEEPTGIIVINGEQQFDGDGNPMTIGLLASSTKTVRAARCSSARSRPVSCDVALA